MIQAQEFIQTLKLTTLVKSTKTELDIREADINRPGMQFCGYYEYFAFERPQVIGKVEMSYLDDMDEAARKLMLKRYFAFDMPCIIITRGMNPPQDLLTEAQNHDIPVLQSQQQTTRFTINLLNYLTQALAPHINHHGVLVDVYGIGVMITGESGVGKSEAALELIKRGHQLIADDVVDVCRVNDEVIVGQCPEMVRHFMEIRGIGIINIKELFGVGAVRPSKKIDLVMHMEHWRENKDYDRLGLETDSITILGVSVPKQILPVRPGRNVAVIIEVAARNYSLGKLGYSAAQELDRRLAEMISQGGR